MVKVSFIVPVYKIKENYLKKCIESLLNQSLEEIEIILIDDGSPDGCGKICDEYAKEDLRIKSVHQENSGVSVARNNGIIHSKGEIIIFVDSDDWVDSHLAEYIYSFTTNSKASIVLYGYNSVYEEKYEKHLLGNNQIFMGDNIKNLQLGILNPMGDSLFNIPASPWAKAFKRDFLIDNMLQFVPRLKRMQDNVFCFDAYDKAEEVYYLNYIGYYWRASESSVCFKYNPEIIEISEKVISEFRKRIDVISNQEFEEMYKCKIINILFGEYIRSYFRHVDNEKERKDIIVEFKKLCNCSIYKEAIENVNTEYLGKRYALMTWLARKNCYKLMWLILDIKEFWDKCTQKSYKKFK